MGPRMGRCWILAIACLLAVAGAAFAAPPEDTTYQGRLLDAAGDPLAGSVEIEIGVWTLPTGGFRLYSETHSRVDLVDGIFEILIGTGESPFGFFNAALFAGENRYLEVIVEGEVLAPRQPFSSVAYALRSDQSETAAHATTAGDADTVDGSHASSLDQSAHVSDTGNPHGVTAAQAGAVSSADLAAHAAETAAHHQKTTTFAELTDQAADAQIPDDITVNQAANADTVDGQHASAFASASHSHDTRYYTQAEVDAIVSSLQAQIDALTDLTQHLSRSGDDLYVAGANLHIVDGSGDTSGTVNGLGNLIVGYNELRGNGTDDRTGSHNLIVGSAQSYSSYGGLVAGSYNSVLAPLASVTGGYSNTANAGSSSVSGGRDNTAGGMYASVSGGRDNTANGTYASVSGGADNEAMGERSSVSGGENNTASQYASSVSGGANNTASGYWASVAGGGGVDLSDGNEAFANFGAILGGQGNLAGDPDKLDHAIGEASSVSGGWANHASGNRSSVSGGANNTASGSNSSVSGGGNNTASGSNSSVSGGGGNHASGNRSSVSGGGDNTASNEEASVSGGTTNNANDVHSSVSGGTRNTASGGRSSVSGGANNTATGSNSSVSGGRNNTATGSTSSVSGGDNRSVTGQYDWRGGSYFSDD